ncbi:DUF1310 family protein [Streptococcus suis]|uniref:DUF1310 family protein n=3 Tax=Streptococcus suis TaxID=1307 RepID=A0A0Z8K4R6_STRSU|nr:DUF1310 family protein [Streptococcus suis]AER18554.1 protein of unknown function DUF1310 [Streptococcus suis D12]ANC99194.1 hypothetical protein A6M16_01200 [Streptococcus suis]AOM73914.1 hypothetical protein BFP66_01090 [Streptococcus suis]MBL6515278.1 DUF1310 family protein [Streptococcus suis]MBM0272191.1 DUF1310 family protein [Streptococcus suis]
MKTVVKILVGVIAAIALGIGGFKLMQKIEHDQMVEIVKSEEVREIVEEQLKYLDNEALSEDGLIKTYEIDDSSIIHSPMGGISFNVFLNSDRKLRVVFELEKDSNTGKIEYSGGGYSSEVKKLVGEINND